MKKLEIILKNILLRLLLLFSHTKKKAGSEKFNENSKILIIRLNRIGDALVTTPLIMLIKKHVNCKIHVLADKNNYFIFARMPELSKLFVYPKGIGGFFTTRVLIKREKYDAIIDAHDDISATVTYLLAFSRCPNKFGLGKGNDLVYTKTVPRKNPVNSHVIERISELAVLFGIKPDKEELNVKYIPKQDSLNTVSEKIAEYFPEKKYLVGLNISAGSLARFWGVDNFIKLISILKQYNLNVLVICSPRDKELASEISGKTEKLYYSDSFDEFAAMISRLNLLFTPDTAAVHLASANCIPVFGLYVKYQTEDMIWSPYKSDFDVVVTTEPNLDNVSFNDVENKFKLFLEKHIK